MSDAAREMPPQITMLREIRNCLRDTLREAQHMQHKLTGPRPKSPEQELKQLSTDSVQSLLLEINRLACDLQCAVAEHHQIIGEFGEATTSVPTNRYA